MSSMKIQIVDEKSALAFAYIDKTANHVKVSGDWECKKDLFGIRQRCVRGQSGNVALPGIKIMNTQFDWLFSSRRRNTARDRSNGLSFLSHSQEFTFKSVCCFCFFVNVDRIKVTFHRRNLLTCCLFEKQTHKAKVSVSRIFIHIILPRRFRAVTHIHSEYGLS